MVFNITTLLSQVSSDQVGTMTAFARFLQNYGGWGVAVVFIVGLVAYYRHQTKISENRNEKFIELLRECATVLGQDEAAHSKVEDALRDNKQLMEDNKRVLDRVERMLDER